ncbi:helix-turn-helix domain-containing protein [Streptomyces sp. NPDC057950]|uniref:helix-turn-helix domain-containing protein n=1 Tax=Streptomyces sp. NPDC057950 TaxID=3346288 RepID=UPI0036F0FF14
MYLFVRKGDPVESPTTGDPATPLPGREERRRLREAKSLSHADIAAEVGVTAATVRSWESGRTTPCGRERDAYARLLTSTGMTRHQEDVPEGPDARDDHSDHSDRRRPRGLGRHGDDGGDARPGGPQDEAAPVLAGVAAGPVQPPPRPANPPAAPTGSGAEPAAGPGAEPAAGPGWGPGYEPVPVGLTPAQAFDALYGFCAPALLRQTYLLTGRRELARESVERAFQSAWQRWPEVAVDRDPAGWVRAVAYEYALSPWHRLRPRYRHAEPPPADAADRALLSVLLELPPMHRRTLLLYDGVGLDLPDTAAETEASTPAAANRLLRARETVATRLPELAAPENLHRRLAEVAGTERLGAGKPFMVRWASERRVLRWTRAAMAFTAVFIGITSLTLRAAPDHYEPPLAPGATVNGLPPRIAPGPLSQEELALRARLKAATASGPERLVPDPR